MKKEIWFNKRNSTTASDLIAMYRGLGYTDEQIKTEMLRLKAEQAPTIYDDPEYQRCRLFVDEIATDWRVNPSPWEREKLARRLMALPRPTPRAADAASLSSAETLGDSSRRG